MQMGTLTERQIRIGNMRVQYGRSFVCFVYIRLAWLDFPYASKKRKSCTANRNKIKQFCIVNGLSRRNRFVHFRGLDCIDYINLASVVMQLFCKRCIANHHANKPKQLAWCLRGIRVHVHASWLEIGTNGALKKAGLRKRIPRADKYH